MTHCVCWGFFCCAVSVSTATNNALSSPRQWCQNKKKERKQRSNNPPINICTQTHTRQSEETNVFHPYTRSQNSEKLFKHLSINLVCKIYSDNNLSSKDAAIGSFCCVSLIQQNMMKLRGEPRDRSGRDAEY